jgi:hypothetical protein
MKKISILMLLTLSIVAVTSCSEDTVVTPPIETPTDNVVISGALIENTTWTADVIYELANEAINYYSNTRIIKLIEFIDTSYKSAAL